MQDKLDRDLKDMTTVEKLSEKELKDRTIITESLIYGQ